MVVLASVVVSCGTSPPLTGSLAKMSAISPEFKVAVAHLRDKPLVVNFWATWCDPCKAELPRLAEAARRYRGRVGFLGVDVQDDSAAAARFARRFGVTYPSVPDPERSIARSQGLLGLPVTQFYDASGKQVGVHQGELRSDVLQAELRKLTRG
jgi:thiol-disulfide isomerase/thioredoxin